MAYAFLLTALLAVAADPSDSMSYQANSAPPARTAQRPRSAGNLRTAVHDALRADAGAKGAEQDASLRQLVAIFHELEHDTLLRAGERNELRSTVRSRLLRRGESLAKQVAQERKRQERAAPVDLQARAIHAQQQPALGQGMLGPGVAGGALQQAPGGVPRPGMPLAGGQGAGGPMQLPGGQQDFAALTAQNAQDLVKLIHATISPLTWDVNGGVGHVEFFGPKQVLVVRQTPEVHQQLVDILQQLR